MAGAAGDADVPEDEGIYFAATQFYGGTLDPDPEPADDPFPEPADDPLMMATQAYGDDFNENPEPESLAFVGTQLYMDGMQNENLDTLLYDDAAMENAIPHVSEGMDFIPELAATQAYPDFELADTMPADPVDEMPPPKLPSRLKRPKLVPECPQAVATPARSATVAILDVLDEDFPVRRRLSGKQPPPCPNPFSSTAPGSGRGDSKGKATCKASTKRRSGRSGRPRKAYFVCTGLVLDEARCKKLKSSLGITVLENWSSKVTHVIAKDFKRTTKLMCGVCAGLPIVTPAFIDECLKAGELISEAPFLLRDEAAEASFATKRQLPSFSLQAAVQRARAGGLLKGKSVYWHGDDDEKEELKLLVEAAKGRWLKRKPKKPKLETAIPKSIVLGQDFDPELLREAACTQEMRWDTYRL